MTCCQAGTLTEKKIVHIITDCASSASNISRQILSSHDKGGLSVLTSLPWWYKCISSLQFSCKVAMTYQCRSIGGYNLIVIMHTSNKDFQQVHAEGL